MARRKRVQLVEIEVNGEQVKAKECTKCSIVKPLEMYNKSNDGSVGGRNARCKECRRKYREDNAEKLSKRRRDYYEENKEEIRRKQAEYWVVNREHINEMNKQRYRDNKPRKAAYDREYRKENRERINANGRRWYAENIEKERERNIVKQANRRAIERGLKAGFDEEWKRMLKEVYGGCVMTGEQDDIHWDHFIPLDTREGGTHFGNMVPLQSKLNLRKGISNPIDFLIDEGITESRLLDILWILSYLNNMSVDEYIKYVDNCFKEKEAK